MLVDAAAEVLTVPNVHLQLGVDLVAYSGGKCLRGPQTAGLLLGRRDLVKAAWVHSAPHHGFARGMKVGKEEAVAMLMAVEMWAKRDHEAELLFRGTRIQNAIARYAADYEIRKATRPNRYPLSLEELTQRPKRYLQAVYKDPITGEGFELIKVRGEVRGVRSRSKERPLDRVRFTDAETYDQITFQAIEARGQPCRTVPNPINPLNPFGAAPC